jgi:hypothetical protein
MDANTDCPEITSLIVTWRAKKVQHRIYRKGAYRRKVRIQTLITAEVQTIPSVSQILHALPRFASLAIE